MLLAIALAAQTWCWSPDLKTATCIYAEKQCRELIQFRRKGVCLPSDRWRELQNQDRI